jgi:hypothetical protein
MFTNTAPSIQEKELLLGRFVCRIYQPKLTIDVVPCFVLRANRSLVGILYNNGLRHVHSPRSSPFLLVFLPLLSTRMVLFSKVHHMDFPLFGIFCTLRIKNGKATTKGSLTLSNLTF